MKLGIIGADSLSVPVSVTSAQAYGTVRERWAKKKESFVGSLKDFFSNQRKRKQVVAIVTALVFLGLGARVVFYYNQFCRQLAIVNSTRAAINRELRRRANLIPNLVKVTNGYMVYEEDLYKYIADGGLYQFTSILPRKTLDLTSPLADQLSKMLFGRKLARIIAYDICWPNIRVAQTVEDLMKEASNTENRLIQAKKEYNEACVVYNRYRSIIPGRLLGFIFGFDFVPYLGAGGETLEVPNLDIDLGPIEETLVAPDLRLGVFKTVVMPDAGKEEEINASPTIPDIAEDGVNVFAIPKYGK